MTTRISAIETVYKGYRFRSRLEARWAVFFDAMDVPWEYEPTGFTTPDGWYLPDFWLPRAYSGKGMWVEIKATEPSKVELRKLGWVCHGTGSSGSLLVGDPLTNTSENFCASGYGGVFGVSKPIDPLDLADGEPWDDDYSLPFGFDGPAQFNVCKSCGNHGAPYLGREDYLGCSCGVWKNYPFESHELVAAAEAARMTRFEHGESPNYRRRYA